MTLDWLTAADRTSPWPRARVLVAGLGASGFAAADGLLQFGARVRVRDESTSDVNVEKGTLLEILDADGQIVVETFALGAMGEFKEFSKVVTLPVGKYRLLAYSPDMSDGESGFGPRLFETTVEFTVK